MAEKLNVSVKLIVALTATLQLKLEKVKCVTSYRTVAQSGRARIELYCINTETAKSQMPVKHVVEGSNPSSPTKKIKLISFRH